MECPVDKTALVMSDRQGIEIDYCPKCRGVWLDRGELDKIIDRSATEAPSAPAAASHPHHEDRRDDREYRRDDDHNYRRDDHRDHYRDDHRSGQYGHKKKREGFLGDIFDFGD